MRARIGGSGILLTFIDQDRPTLLSRGVIEGRFDDYLRPTIKVHICDVVDNGDDVLCEPGFRIKTTPFGPPEKRESYEVWLSKENVELLMIEGFWGTRSKLDRVDMSYLGSN